LIVFQELTQQNKQIKIITKQTDAGNVQKYTPLMVLKNGTTLQIWPQFQGLF